MHSNPYPVHVHTNLVVCDELYRKPQKFTVCVYLGRAIQNGLSWELCGSVWHCPEQSDLLMKYMLVLFVVIFYTSLNCNSLPVITGPHRM